MARVTIYVSDEMKAHMETAGEANNWSVIAQDAFQEAMKISFHQSPSTTKLYRIIEYDGPMDWIVGHIVRSRPIRDTPRGIIRVATIDPDDKISVSIAANKIGVLIAELNLDEEKGFGNPTS